MPLPIVVMTSHSGGDIPPVDSVVVLRPAGSKSGWTVPIVLVLLTWAALGGVVFNGFVNYDDDLYLTANPSLTVGSAIDKLTWALTTTHSGNWHPLTWISHLIDVRIFGMNPAWHHAVSLALHTANALLLFALLRGLTGVIWPSALVAALFAIHPLHVESVAWAAERKDVLSTLFALAAALAFVRGVRQPGSGAWRVATPMFFALALLAKPMPISLPLLLLLDWWPLGRWSPADLGHPHARHACRARLGQSRRRPWLTVGVFWYLISLLPVIGLVQVGEQAMADRYTYLPLAGIFIAAAWGLREVAGRGRRSVQVVAAATFVVIGLRGVVTACQVGTWRNSFTLFSQAVAATGGRHEEAVGWYGEAIARDQSDPVAHRNLGQSLQKSGRLEEALTAYREALRLEPRDPRTLDLLGVALARAGRVGEGMVLLETAADSTPGTLRSVNTSPWRGRNSQRS